MTETPAPTALLQQIGPRAGPLIMTVFGDTIAPRGGAVWLTSLISLMEPFGLSERLVRTGVYRLAREGWLESTAAGRKSIYTITGEGLAGFAEADARIYNASEPGPAEQWLVVEILNEGEAKTRQQLRRHLTWRGFGHLNSSTFIKPVTGNFTLPLEFAEVATLFEGKRIGGRTLASLAGSAWDLDQFASAYDEFVKQFEPITGKLPTDPLAAFMIRILAVHQYRRILLKDPQLPAALLPASWPGKTARNLAANLYHSLREVSEIHIAEHLECPSEKIQSPPESYFTRFTLQT